MLRIRHLLFSLPLLLSACSAAPPAPPPDARTVPVPVSAPQPERIIAAWIPYFSAEALLSDPDEAICREHVGRYLQRLTAYGINTVFVHVCAFGESMYPSVYYPALPAAGHDGMQIFTDICAEQGIALHAWINPLRLQTGEIMEQQTGDAALCEWYHSKKLRKRNLTEWDGRFYLNPAAESTRKFLTGAVTELMLNYHPAGIHIDDYFYPAAAPEFDADDFSRSGADDLAQWRRGNITAMTQAMYRAVHAADDGAVFSVSPQGNLQKNRDALYADIPAWCAAGGCCDLIIPQLYFGYRNETCPFAEMLREWTALPRADSVRMAVGLAPYKYGHPDPNAGSGRDEWCSAEKLPAVQTEDVLSDSTLCGAVYYHADALLTLPETEADALKDAVRRHGGG